MKMKRILVLARPGASKSGLRFLFLLAVLGVLVLAGCGGSGGGFSSGSSTGVASKAQVVTGPTVVSASIVNGATNVNTGLLVYPGITVTFSEPMNPGTFYGWSFTGPNGSSSGVPMYYTWNADDTAVTFDSSGNFMSYGTTYTLTINNTRLLSAGGTPLAAPFSVSFTTTPAPVVNDISGLGLSGSWGTAGPTGLAIDNSSGDLWVSNFTNYPIPGSSTNWAVTKLTPTGGLIGNYLWWANLEGYLNVDEVASSPLVTDSSGDVWTAGEGLYSEFDPAGNMINWFCGGSNNPYYAKNCWGGTPSGMVVDASGNLWAAIHGNGNAGTDLQHGDSCVLELSSTGSPIGVYAAGSYPSAIAFDHQSGNIWVTDQATGSWNDSENGSVTELSPDGAIIATYPTGPGPVAITIDKSGDIWVANHGIVVDTLGVQESSVTELVPSDGTYISKTYWAAGRPVSITTDSSGNVWMLNNDGRNISGDGVITELSPSGEFLNAYWPTNGYLNPTSDWGLGTIVIDSAGNVWVTNPGLSSPYGLMEFVGIASKTATVTLSNLNQYYSGYPEPVTVATNPSGLTVNVTYDGSTTPPTAVGSYAVVATVTAPGYAGSASGTLTISVKPSPVSLVVTSSLSALSGGYQAAVKVTNNGGSTADNVELTTATLGSAAGTPLPQSLGNIAGSGSATATVTFPLTAGGAGTYKFLKIGGTYTGGTFSSGRWVKLP